MRFLLRTAGRAWCRYARVPAVLCILVVEDDFEVAESLSIVMANLGAAVVGPTGTMSDTCKLIESDQVDVAILDVALRLGTSAALARILRSGTTASAAATAARPPANATDRTGHGPGR